ncbi:MAG: PAS domain S-box protein [Coleofasciculaceae cyanobacterium SM2_3_26]|nr:PAS domain S-box protein [Coleofasciculaceae cyanobacterium SM2_3_26]
MVERTAALRDREAQLQDLFENANDLIQSVRLEDGRFEYVNRAWRETLGYSEAEIAQLTIFDVLHPEYHGHCDCLMARIKREMSAPSIAWN